MYPNPSHGPATFSYSLDREEEVQISLIDMNGRVMAILDCGVKSEGSHSVEVNLGQYINDYGIYFAKFQSASQTNVMKIVYTKQ